MNRTVLFGLVAVVLWGGSVAADEASDNLVRLETHLEKIRKEYEFGRWMGGGGLVTTGAFIAGAGTALSFYFIPDTTAPGMATSRNLGIALSVAYGGLFIVPGALVLVLKSDFETMPEQFSKLPSANGDEVLQKVVRGEVTLQSLADKARFERFLSAGLIGLAGGSAMWLAASNHSTYTSNYGLIDSPPLASDPSFQMGALYVGVAVLRLLLTTTPENENQAYLRWKEAR